MMKAAKGIVFKYGDNVDTDVIIPARYLNSSDPAELATHCMEDIDSDFVKKYGNGWCLERYSYLIKAPFDLTNRCCNFMKKDPMHDYNKVNNTHPYIGTMTEESQLRKKSGLSLVATPIKPKIRNLLPCLFGQSQMYYIVC